MYNLHHLAFQAKQHPHPKHLTPLVHRQKHAMSNQNNPNYTLMFTSCSFSFIKLPITNHNCTSSSCNLTTSPFLNAGKPMYGHPSQRKASPNAQLPQLPTFPFTVKSTSARSPAFNFARFWSAAERLAASSASSRCARPQVQSLQARRRLPVGGRQDGADEHVRSLQGFGQIQRLKRGGGEDLEKRTWNNGSGEV